MIVYAALYNGMIHESSFATLSLHRTRRGAEMAIEFHKQEVKKEHDEVFDDKHPAPFAYDEFKAWLIEEMEVAE